MLENMALQEGEEHSTAPAQAKPFRFQFARFVSTILSPITVSLPVMFLVALYHQESASFLFAAIALLFLSIGPMLYIFIGVCLGKFSDIDVSIRSQRTGPFLFGIGSSILGLIVLSLYHAPKNIETVLLTTVLLGCILFIITLRWKISMHASSLSGAVTLLSALYGRIVLPAFLLVLLVGWSRVVLKRHTAAQVAAGALLTMLLILTVVLIRGT